MGSRLLPLSLALAALVADAGGGDRLAYYLVLLAVVGAAAAAFVMFGDALAGRRAWPAAVSSGLALVLLLIGSVLRANAPVGAAVPVFAVSTLVMAAVLYASPALGWLLEPLVPRGRAVRVRTDP
jgi:hypothetical protein